jgi:HAD superfamily hydrolase (TIGR01456 family)
MRRFGIAFDVDGVLLRGRVVLPGAVEALVKVRKMQIPHGVLTNGGGVSERDFGLNLQALGLPLLDPNQVCLAHSPLQEMMDLRDQVVVCFGRKNPCQVAKGYGFRFAVTPEQFCTVHNLFPFEKYADSLPAEVHDKVLHEPAGAAFVMTDPLIWGRDIQLICDLACHSMPLGGLPSREKPLRVVFAQNDFQWSHSFPLPRFGQGAFNLACSVLFQRTHGQELKAEVMGKPTAVTMDYFKRKTLQNVDVAYMVGDNLESDIRGANNAPGWKSVLVKTGLYQGGPRAVEPNYVVGTVLDAVNLILDLERRK